MHFLAVASLFAASPVITAAQADAAEAALAASILESRDEVAQGVAQEVAQEVAQAPAPPVRGDAPPDEVVGGADEPACRFGDVPAPLEEMAEGVAHETLTMHDGWGTLVIEKQLLNVPRGPGFRTDDVALAAGMAVVVGATLSEDEGAFRPAHLDDSVAAADLFESYKRALENGVPPEEVREGAHGAAVLVSTEGDGVRIDVAAPCSVRIITVRIEVRLSSLPRDGAWVLYVPRIGPLTVDAAFPMRLLVEGAVARSRTAIALAASPSGEAAAAATSSFAMKHYDAPIMASPDAPVDVEVVVKPLTGPKLRARGFATVVEPKAAPAPADVEDALAPAEDGSTPAVKPVIIARAELDLPRPLAEAPAGLRLVFVVDASVSVGQAALEKQWQVLDGILDAAPPDAKYAVVTAARRPKVVVGPWRDRLDRERPEVVVTNGSDVLGAIKKARGIASDIDDDDGAGGVREVPRIVVLSDMQLPFAVDDAALVHAFDGAPLSHVVVTADAANIEEGLAWQRSFGEDDARAKGPESTGGIWVETGFGNDDESVLFPHLIKPMRVDLPRVTVGGDDVLGDDVASVIQRSPLDVDTIDNQDDGLPMYLVEGSGLRVEAARDVVDADGKRRSARGLHIGGWLWGTPLDEKIAKDDTSLLGIAAVDEVGRMLSDDLVRSVATREHAVSRVTSLVDVPAWRPAQPEGASLYGCGCGGCSCCCGTRGIGCSGFGTGGAGVDLHERETLARLLAADARACLLPKAAVDVEFGDLEILDVKVTEGGACVLERVWSHRLDRLVVGTERDPGAFSGHRTLAVAATAAAR